MSEIKANPKPLYVKGTLLIYPRSPVKNHLSPISCIHIYVLLKAELIANPKLRSPVLAFPKLGDPPPKPLIKCLNKEQFLYRSLFALNLLNTILKINLLKKKMSPTIKNVVLAGVRVK
jgi:hypothetical protein